MAQARPIQYDLEGHAQESRVHSGDMENLKNFKQE